MREIAFPGVDLTAKSGYSGQDYTTYINSGFHIPVPAKLTITPLVSLQYSRVNIDSYTETGAGDIDLHVKPQGYNFLESGLGVKVERAFSFHHWTLIPDLHFKWLYDFRFFRDLSG
jgi:outer membrane autotransporter protein